MDTRGSADVMKESQSPPATPRARRPTASATSWGGRPPATTAAACPVLPPAAAPCVAAARRPAVASTGATSAGWRSRRILPPAASTSRAGCTPTTWARRWRSATRPARSRPGWGSMPGASGARRTGPKHRGCRKPGGHVVFRARRDFPVHDSSTVNTKGRGGQVV